MGNSYLSANPAGINTQKFQNLFLELAKILNFHQAFFSQGLQAVVDVAQTQTQLRYQFPMAEIEVSFQNAHCPTIRVLLDLDLTTGHVALGHG